MKFMLDTNICIYVINERPPSVVGRFRTFSIGDVGISAITLAELEYGAAKSSQPRRNREALGQFISPLEVAAFDADATSAYGQIRTALEKRGTPIGPMDMLIAAHAIGLGVMLITNNKREFARVPGLRIENWL
jgi:tRNA(fMet)-specific endonuclease VapC